MRIRTWNAYASNNSGSYTIVGELPSEEVAREMADELRAVITAQTAWNQAEAKTESPLATFCKERGLAWSEHLGGDDEWPAYSKDNDPQVLAVGHQLIVHHDYTVTLPPSFGEYIYKRGGRVSHEENHAHFPIVVIGTFWWGWRPDEKARQEKELPRLVAALTASDGILATQSPSSFAPAWQTSGGRFGDAPFTVGVILDEIVAGVAILDALAREHGAHFVVRLHEMPSDRHDPFTHLRPSAPAVPRFDVVVDAVGPDAPKLVSALFAETGRYEGDAKRILVDLPAIVATGCMTVRAQAIAAALAATGATVRVVVNDG